MAGLRKILIVEDNLELRNLYVLFLHEHDFEVDSAIDGEDALVQAKSFKPDLIFLDIMMPKLDGLEVLKILRHDESYGCTKIKIVILTNLGDSGRVNDDIRKDMDGYVVKAEIVLDDLISIIKSFDEKEETVPEASS